MSGIWIEHANLLNMCLSAYTTVELNNLLELFNVEYARFALYVRRDNGHGVSDEFLLEGLNIYTKLYTHVEEELIKRNP